MTSSDRFTVDLRTNESLLRNIFVHCSDIVFRSIPSQEHMQWLVVYADGLVDTREMENTILKPIVDLVETSVSDGDRRGLDLEGKGVLAAANMTTSDEIHKNVDGVLRGQVLLIAEGTSKGFLADFSKFPQRAIEEPVIEASIRGPREGFTEALRTNTSMIRRKLCTPRLKLESMKVGSLSNTDIVFAYLEGTAPDALVDEVRDRLRRIETESILDASYIEEFIQDHKTSPFPQLQNTERPDTVASSLLEGKVAILVNGSPNALIAPMTFWNGFQAAEDHYEKYLYVSGVRIIRLLLFSMSLILPSFYVALTTFHPQMIPVALMMSISAAREGIPFPTVVETFLMEIMFEGLREAGLRLPKAIGSAVSIVGAIVIGEAAVQAGFISAPIVIIVASTGIASFSIPRYSMSLPFRLLRFPLLALAGTFGLFGVAAGAIAILTHLCNLESFKKPYFTPVAPLQLRHLKAALIRPPRGRRGL